MLDAVSHLVDAGFAAHWLRPKSKAPVASEWSTAPVYSAADLRASYRPGYNIGARLGEPSRLGDLYLHVIDLDIRDPGRAAAAQLALREFLPEVDTLPFVISGSGGESRHFYFLCDRPFRSKKLAHSAEKVTGADSKPHWAWEIELFGTGKQVAMPPSIHPDTGQPYRWGRELDLDLLEMGVGPEIPSIRVETWAPDLSHVTADEDDDLSALVSAKPMGLSRKEIDDTLDKLPLADFCDDRDGWLTVGMALHHEFEGSDEGLAVWNAFSAKSDKFDAKDQRRVWESFRTKPGSTRMATLIKAASEASLRAELDIDDLLGDAPASDDIDDLLGDPLEAATTTDWVSLLDLAPDTGAIKPTLHNVELIIRNDVRSRGLTKFNEFSREIVLRGKPGLKRSQNRSDHRLPGGGDGRERWHLPR